MYFYSHSLFLNLLAAVKLNKTRYVNLAVIFEGKITGVSFYCDVSHSSAEVCLTWRLSAPLVSKRGTGERVWLGFQGTWVHCVIFPHPGNTQEKVLSITATLDPRISDKYKSPRPRTGAELVAQLLEIMCFKLPNSYIISIVRRYRSCPAFNGVKKQQLAEV